MHLVPNCGVDVVGCSIEVDFWYLDFDSLELSFKVDNDTVEGLSNDQIEMLYIRMGEF
jgi:hypothetical protein